MASGSSSFRSFQPTAGRPIGGQALRHLAQQLDAVRLQRRDRRGRDDAARSRPAATPAGSAGSACRPAAAPAPPAPRPAPRPLVCGEVREEAAMRSQKSPPGPPKPNSFGSCVLARTSAMPALKPIITVSEMKLTTDAAPAPASDQRHAAHDQRGGGGQRAEARRVAAGQRAERGADQQRDRRGDRDRGVARAAEQPEHQAREQAGVEAGLGRQVRPARRRRWPAGSR